jgi:hypothetical protein
MRSNPLPTSARLSKTSIGREMAGVLRELAGATVAVTLAELFGMTGSAVDE